MKASFCLLTLVVATATFSQGYAPANYKSLKWVSVGPDLGGRSLACSGVRTRPNEFYFGATGGGLWKSDNAGNTWKCVTDGFLGSSSVGAVAVSDSNPNVVYIGTGERDIRGDISQGDGLYKSTDAGKTWKRAGLEATKTISRIVIDPKSPDVVYVAALGDVYQPGPDRGVYKSTDGGKTWTQVLFESERAGAVDIQMDPSDPNTLYAATWEAWRTPYFMNSGGPGSKLWKSIDAGAHWKDITRNTGLPSGVVGKIGIAVSPVNHERVYASVEAKNGGIFQSDDGGSTWKLLTADDRYRQRAWYFSHIFADPKNVNKLYCLNVGSAYTVDGGKKWTGFRPPHGDNHDLWLDPDDPNRMIESNDGGASVSVDGAKTWTPENTPTAEMYHVVADNHFPYRIYGAQQDRGSVRVSPNQFSFPGRPNWTNTGGGESGWIAVKPNNPSIEYGGEYDGSITRLNSRTMTERQIDPWPDNPMGHGAANIRDRFQWTFPIVASPHNPNVLYTASQYLYKTSNEGQSWDRISPDLTRNDKAKQRSSGGPITQDNTSVEYYDTIFTVAESPVRAGVIWTGSDDGMVHVTRDGGGTWTDVTPTDMPKWGRVSMVDASPLDAGTAYVAVNNYQNGDDVAPYIYRTHNFGQTWTKIVTGIPDGAFARVCRADLHRKGLLYAGTETGAYVSFDDGDHWQPLQQNLPLCPVHDLTLKDDDLIAATHGRSFWVLHHVHLLEELQPSAPATATLYKPVDVVGASTVSVDYYLPAKAKSVRIQVFGRDGKAMGGAKGPVTPGMHTVSVSVGHLGFGTFPGMVLWSGSSQPIPAPPGEYRVQATFDNGAQSAPVRLLKDPRVRASQRDLEAQYAFSVKLVRRINDANHAVVRIRDTQKQIDAATKQSKNDPDVVSHGTALKANLEQVEEAIYQVKSHSGEDPLNYPVRLNDRLAGDLDVVQSGRFAPSRQAGQVFDELSQALQVQLDRLRQIEATGLPAFNALLKAKSIAPVVPKTPKLTHPKRRFRFGT